MKSATFLLALTLAAPACSKGQDQIPSTPALTPAPATAAGDPGAGAAAKNAALVGTVFERIDAATYSYLRLKTADGEVWAAVPATPVEVGASVTVVEPMKMSKFESKTLGRTFDLIYFGKLQGQEGAAPMGGGAMGGGAMAGGAMASLVGTVLERIDAATYSYLRLKTADGEVWAAVPATPVDVGASVTVVEPMKMSKFESKTLGRTFDLIYFGRLQGQEGAAPMGGGAMGGGAMGGGAMGGGAMGGGAMGGGAMGGGAMGGGQGDPQAAEALAAHGAPAPAAADVHVDKAEEGFSIAEIWAQKAELGGKQVIVRGKIVKYNANILGKNWIHLQDGTGDPTSATHDLAVTTKDEATVGDVVTVTGTLQLDQEFGAGYAYAAIVQDAKLTK